MNLYCIAVLLTCYQKLKGNFFQASGRSEKRSGGVNSMDRSSLELKVISCRHLKAFNFFQKLSVYAAVSIINGDSKKKEQQQQCLQRQKTPVDREGGTKPEWNHLMKFDLKALDDDFSHFLISFDLHCEGVVYGKKTVGKVRVSLKDLIDEFNGAVRFVSYQVRANGKPNGVLNFSYKLKGTAKDVVTASPEVDLSTGFHSSADRKVNYPSLEVGDKSRDICYPSLDDIQSPLPGLYTPSPSPKYEYKTDVRGMINPPPPLSPQMSPHMTANESYCHPYQVPMVQTPGRWYMVESSGYGYGYGYGYGWPNVRQLGTFDIERQKV
ncbi:hypothetical protein Ddye_029515 [Dipteronia dyeriana]|uniref:C2 domain-containing protein n=1 Tax=Dipteronia dyeriana TaxID=168575 RepID=A0AAD9TF97_9ROSI|nr:hypothetical protein Ddye_029515 [Dipteronia dyeriana]